MDEIKIEKRTVYQVESNTDKIEGCGSTYIVDTFINKSMAQLLVDADYYCNKMKKVTKEVVCIYKGIKLERMCLVGNPVNLITEDPKIVKARALAKLTEEERKVLGI